MWGGEEGCEHEWGEELKGKTQTGGIATGVVSSHQDDRTHFKSLSQFCHLCGAWQGSLGLEPTIDLYVQHITEIFREVRRVLRKDGICFLNIGDSYAHSAPGRNRQGTGGQIVRPYGQTERVQKGNSNIKHGLKPKDLCMIPARVALSLQSDGWWLRSEITWVKPNPMPESVTDRPTKSTEKIYLLTKSAKYFWDAEAVREGCNSGPSDIKKMLESKERIGGLTKDSEDLLVAGSKFTNIGRKRAVGNPSGRNLQDAWTIATEPFPEAHFATFPQKLVETCIKAGSSEKGCCPKCGAPWGRVVERKASTPGQTAGYTRDCTLRNDGDRAGSWTNQEIKVLGWQPSCKCGETDTNPCTILDPFGGSGTVGLVAAKMGRDAILLELKQEYCDMAAKRIKNEMGMLVEILREKI